MTKGISCALALLAGASAVYSQGTVSMANYAALKPYLYVSYKAAYNVAAIELGGSKSGPPATLSNFAAETANGYDWSVQLYAAPGLNATTLVPVPGTVVTLGTNAATLGIWASTANAFIPGTTAGGAATATLELYVWYNAGGLLTSFETAEAAGVPVGTSAVANITGLGGGSPPATASSLPESLGNITIGFVPEPSTVALGVLGASAYLMRFRRKS